MAVVEDRVPGYWRISVDDVRPMRSGDGFRFEGEIRPRETLYTLTDSPALGLNLVKETVTSGSKIKFYGIVEAEERANGWGLRVKELEPDPAQMGQPRSFFVGALLANSPEATAAIAAAEKAAKEDRERAEAEARVAREAEAKRKEAFEAAAKKAADERVAAIKTVVDRTRDALLPGTVFEGVITLTDNESEWRVPARARVVRADGFIVEMEFKHPEEDDQRYRSLYRGEILETFDGGVTIDALYPVKMSASDAHYRRTGGFHGMGGNLQLRATPSGEIEGAGKAYNNFKFKLRPVNSRAPSASVDEVRAPKLERVAETANPLSEQAISGDPLVAAPSLDPRAGSTERPLGFIPRIQDAAKQAIVLRGSTGSKPDDQFELRSLQITGATLKAEYYETRSGGSAMWVSGPVSESGWKFRGSEWTRKAEGAIGTPDSFTGNLTFDASRSVLAGKYRAAVLWGGTMTVAIP